MNLNNSFDNKLINILNINTSDKEIHRKIRT